LDIINNIIYMHYDNEYNLKKDRNQ
jgi:hypothetical protein